MTDEEMRVAYKTGSLAIKDFSKIKASVLAVTVNGVPYKVMYTKDSYVITFLAINTKFYEIYEGVAPQELIKLICKAQKEL